MTPERWQKIEAVFHAAAELDADARTAFVAEACGDDLALRREVESLLSGRARPVGIMDAQPLCKAALRLLADEHGSSYAGRVIGRYHLLALLGAGGMGEVYAAEDAELGRKVALKLLPAALTGDDEQVSRLQREARAASALNHPNIITIHETGEAGGLHFIATELIQGETLRQQMRGPRMSVRAALDIAVQIAGALAAAHKAGIIHRDIKPENVMVRDDGYVKVLDFGIAQLKETRASLPEAEAQPRDVAASAFFGTASYMSPEQARGAPLDTRSDLFSLGVLLYELLTGSRPFGGDTQAEVLRAVCEDEPQPLSTLRPNVPPALEEAVGRLLRKNRDERYQSAGELLDDLKRPHDLVTVEEPGAAVSTLQEETEPARATLISSRRYARWLLLVGVLTLVAACLDKLLLQASNVRPARDGTLLLAGAVGLLLYLYARRQGARAAPVTDFHGNAFRGLSPFQESDRDRFYGREDDTKALVEMTCRAAFRFGVLYGDSGAGKTSLVIAGLMPRLRETGRLPLYCRSYKDPLAALVDECGRRTEIQARADEQPLAYLRRVAAERDAEIVAVFDQFEEFFINFRGRRERGPFVSFVAGCHGARDLPVKLLFAIRSDFLYQISAEFDGRVPEPLMGDKRYHLRAFDEEQAEKIIEQSASAAGLPLEPALRRRVARDLARGGSVLPSELQIVGVQLQRRRIFTLEAYERAHGKEQLVYGFLEDVLRAADDPRAARLLLRSLISDEDTRLTLTRAAIAKRTRQSAETVERILSLLAEARLVRVIQEDEPYRYELTHEYLIRQINLLTDKTLDATHRANRLFRQYLSQHAADARTRIPLRKLPSIYRHSDIKRGPREQRLLKQSLRRGSLSVGALTLLLAAGTLVVAATFSVREEWDDVRLSDGHKAAARRAVFSPDGRLLVSAGEDAQVIVWDFARRQRLATLSGHAAKIIALAFSPDGKWFVTGDENSTVIVWDAERWTKATTLGGHLRKVGGLAFSPDGRLLASTSTDPSPGRTILWDVATWQKLREWPVGEEYGALLFTPDGHRLMLSSASLTWDLETGRQIDDGFKYGEVNWATISPDGTTLVGIGPGGSSDVTFSNLTQHKALATYHVHQDNGRAGAYSPDGRFIATGADDIVLWDAATQTKLARLEYPAIVWSLTFSPDGRWLVSTHGDGAILMWDVADRRLVADLNEHGAAVRAVAYSRDGKVIASASEDRSIILWDAETGRKEAVLLGHDTRVTAVAFAPDGTWLASGDQNGHITAWDIPQQKSRWTRNINGSDYCLAVSPDGRWLATTYGVYESADGQRVIDLYGCPNNCGMTYGQAFSADGHRLARVTDDGWLYLWETGSWRLLAQVRLAKVSLISVSFSPDGKWLVTGEDEGAVRLWATGPLREVAVIGRHAARVKSVAFSPDGQQVASAGDDKVIALWDVRGRSLVAHIGTHASPVLSVAFSPDGRHLVSGEHDRSVHVFTRRRTLWGYQLN